MSLLFPLLLLLLSPATVSIKEDDFLLNVIGKCRTFYQNPINCIKFITGDDENNKFLRQEEYRKASTDKHLCKSRCDLPKMRGPCLKFLQRYYFSSKTHKCVKFFYGGCGGNQNNFRTLKECKRKCVQPTYEELEKVRCHSKPDPGPCMAEIKRFFFSPRSNNCYPFTYGGCGGNTNNYNTIESCLRSCRKEEEN